MNPWCANRGDVLKHLVLCELLVRLEGAGVTYVDAFAGRPFNHLMKAQYEFSRRRVPHGGWADQFLAAVEDAPCRRLANSPYVRLLTASHPEGTFWQNGSVAVDPVYPGSAGFAWLLLGPRARWICADTWGTDRGELTALFGHDAVLDDLVGIPEKWEEILSDSGRTTLVLVDPFDLTARGKRGEPARDFVYAAARHHATVAAWYPCGPRYDSLAIVDLAIRLSEFTVPVSTIESSWGELAGTSLNGAGMLLVGLDGQEVTEIRCLVQLVDKLPF